MHRSLQYSLALHAAIIILALINWPSFSWRRQEPEFYTVELVKISDTPNLKQMAPKASKGAPDTSKNTKSASQKAATPKPKPKTEDSKKVEQKKAIPDSKAKAETTKAKEEVAPAPVKKAEKPKSGKQDKPTKTNTSTGNKKATTPAAKQKAKETKPETKDTKNKAEKPSNVASDSLLNNLEKKSDAQSNPHNYTEGEHLSKGNYDPSQELSIRDIDLIRSQIQRNWIDVPAGAKGIIGLEATFYIKLTEDGTVEDVKLSSRLNMADSVVSAFVASGIRAIYRASPFQNLPKDKYKHWREIELTFDPSDLLY